MFQSDSVVDDYLVEVSEEQLLKFCFVRVGFGLIVSRVAVGRYRFGIVWKVRMFC